MHRLYVNLSHCSMEWFWQNPLWNSWTSRSPRSRATLMRRKDSASILWLLKHRASSETNEANFLVGDRGDPGLCYLLAPDPFSWIDEMCQRILIAWTYPFVSESSLLVSSIYSRLGLFQFLPEPILVCLTESQFLLGPCRCHTIVATLL